MQSEYHPTATENKDREKLIKQYFDLHYSYHDIIVSLACNHDIVISYRHLKRLLRQMGLRRRGPHIESPLAVTIAAIYKELQGSGKCLGYRTMWKRLVMAYKLHVKRSTVLELLWIMDPEGVNRRKCHRLLRRKYSNPGPNFAWHMDGYDKIKPYGFSIHGAIDGFSRKILWLRVARSNNNPKIIASYYLSALKQFEKAPTLLRCDHGTENTLIQYLQPYFRSSADDKFSGVNSMIIGKSTANQRIESWWSILRKGNIDWWMTFFKDMRDSGIYNDALPLHKECIVFCFMSLIQRELDRVLSEWNSHNISSSKNLDCPTGKPDIMFFSPAVYNTTSYGTAIDISDVNDCLHAFCGADEIENSNHCMTEFRELIDILKPELESPTSSEAAKSLFIELTGLFQSMGH